MSHLTESNMMAQDRKRLENLVEAYLLHKALRGLNKGYSNTPITRFCLGKLKLLRLSYRGFKL